MIRHTKAKRSKKKTKRSKKKTKKADKPALSLVEDDEVTQIDFSISVWECYVKHRSMRMVAAELDCGLHRVRTVLSQDKPRLERIKQDQIELAAARWEKKENESLEMLDKLNRLYIGMLAAIDEAVAEGKGAKTKIRDKDGFEMPVVNATQLMVNSRMFDQFIKLGGQARSIASALRAGHIPAMSGQGDGSPSMPSDYSQFDDATLVQMIEDGGGEAPEALKLKAELFRKKERQAIAKLDEI